MTLIDVAGRDVGTADACRFCELHLPTAAERSVVLAAGNRAVATVGPLLPSWSLVLGRRHVPSSAWLSAPERHALFEDVDALGSTLGGRVFFFEHGPSSAQSSTACTTSHVHVHVVPVSFDVVEYADNHCPIDGVWRPTSVDGVGEFAGLDYLLAGEVGSGAKVKVLTQPISQYFRRVIAHWTDVPDAWDWRQHSNRDHYQRTQDMLAEVS